MSAKRLKPFGLWVLLVAAAAIVLPARAQEPAGAGSPGSQQTSPVVPTPPTAVQAPEAAPTVPSVPAGSRFTLNDLAWLEGQWNANWGPRQVREIWSTPWAGSMYGTMQVVENGKTLVVELVALAETPTGVEYRVLHFTPSLGAWEKAGPATLTLMSIDPRTAAFYNQAEDEPRQVTMTRTDPDTYISRSEIVTSLGDPQTTQIAFHRVRTSGGSGGHR